MGGRAGVAGVMGAAAGAVALSLALAPSAAADDSVTVHGTAFPDPARAKLSLVGCADLYQRTEETLRPYISLGNAPAGRRSLGYDLAGGNAVGSLHVVGSMAATTVASLAVNAPDSATGVAYVGYQEPADAGTQLVWFGRADLAATPGWQVVDAAGLTYAWTKYDMSTREPVSGLTAGVASTVPEFLVSRGGDGPGLYTIGFGCDGNRFTMDAMRVGSPGAVTTFDLEGLSTATSIDGSHARITAGDEVTLTGSVRTGSGSRVPHATVILEQRTWGSEAWKPVKAVAADPRDPSVVVQPDRQTSYRWRFVDRPVAEGSVSPAYDVFVAPGVEAAPRGAPVDTVTGRTTPALPGTEVTLWQVDGNGSRRVGAAVVGKDGRFTIRVPEGADGRFVVTTADGAGYLEGRSGTFAIEAPEPDPPPPSEEPSPSPEPTLTPDPTPTATATAEPSPSPSALDTAASTLTP